MLGRNFCFRLEFLQKRYLQDYVTINNNNKVYPFQNRTFDFEKRCFFQEGIFVLFKYGLIMVNPPLLYCVLSSLDGL
jgi:hypothetical protein